MENEVNLETHKAGFMNESVYLYEKPPMWVTIVGVVGCFEWFKKNSKCSCNVTSAVCVCRLTEYFGRWPGAKRLLLQFIIILVSLIEPNQQLSSEVDNYSSCVCLQSLLSTGLRKCTLLYFFPLCSRAGYACNKALFIWVSLHSDMRKKITYAQWVSDRLQPALSTVGTSDVWICMLPPVPYTSSCMSSAKSVLQI